MRYIITAAIVAGASLSCLTPALMAENTKPTTTLTNSTQDKAESVGVPNVQLGVPNVQLAILLDTSGSMSGLINQARTQLWKIVNEMTLARQNGLRPKIKIALYEYGNDKASSKNGYIRKVLPLTDDLDTVSTELFKLTTDGSEEYCGAVIDQATKELEWDQNDKNALKMIFIAGNEGFNQGSVKAEDAIKRALAKGITVNTIFCGDGRDSDATGWKDASVKADGSFVFIDHNATPPTPETPYDKELATLGGNLNRTYVAYGAKAVRESKSELQQYADDLSLSAGNVVMAERAVAKGDATSYNNLSWDLVDKSKEGGINIGQLKNEDALPQELKDKSEEEIKAHIDEKAKEREKIQTQIKELNKKRKDWLEEKMKEQKNQPTTLEKAVIESVRKQAAKKKFEFDKK